jgi:chemotaxis protein CheD
MSDIIDLNPGDVHVGKPPACLRTNALGSCVAVVLYDKVEQVGGMAHVMLPSTDHYLQGDDLLKYADEAIPYLIKEIVEVGANRYGLHARLVGGAMIVEDSIDIGSQVVKSCQDALCKHGVEITARRIGGNASRTATLDAATGILWYTENSGMEKAL